MRQSVFELLPYLSDQEFHNALPKGMDEFKTHLRNESIAKLIDAFGGLRLYVPKNASEHHPLALLLGYDEFEKLVYLKGGEEHFDIRICKNLFRIAQEKKMAYLRERGASLRELAYMFYMTERSVLKVLEKTKNIISQPQK